MKSIVNRIIEIQSDKSKSINGFAEIIGIPQPTIDKQLKGLRKISLETIYAVLSAFPDVSADWLILGIGEKYRCSQSGAITINMNNAEHGSVAGNNNTVTYDARTHELEEECAHLREENKQLRDRCDKLTDRLLGI